MIRHHVPVTRSQPGEPLKQGKRWSLRRLWKSRTVFNRWCYSINFVYWTQVQTLSWSSPRLEGLASRQTMRSSCRLQSWTLPAKGIGQEQDRNRTKASFSTLSISSFSLCHTLFNSISFRSGLCVCVCVSVRACVRVLSASLWAFLCCCCLFCCFWC